MTGIGAGPSVAFACRDLGFNCEWALRADSAEEVRARFRDHAKCAHAIDPIPAELSARLDSAVHAAR